MKECEGDHHSDEANHLPVLGTADQPGDVLDVQPRRSSRQRRPPDRYGQTAMSVQEEPDWLRKVRYLESLDRAVNPNVLTAIVSILTN